MPQVILDYESDGSIDGTPSLLLATSTPHVHDDSAGTVVAQLVDVGIADFQRFKLPKSLIFHLHQELRSGVESWTWSNPRTDNDARVKFRGCGGRQRPSIDLVNHPEYDSNHSPESSTAEEKLLPDGLWSPEIGSLFQGRGLMSSAVIRSTQDIISYLSVTDAASLSEPTSILNTTRMSESDISTTQKESLSALIRAGKLHPAGSGPIRMACRTQCVGAAEYERKIRVGVDWPMELRRWDTSRALQYYVDDLSFGDCANYVRTCMAEAVKSWTDPGFGLEVRETRFEWNATFQVKHHRDLNDRDLAEAFFPGDNNQPGSVEHQRTIWIYDKALRRPHKVHLAGVLRHELGHVFGLRHEFAERTHESPSIQIGPANAASVMNNHGDKLGNLKVHEEDIKGLRAFYGITDSEVFATIWGKRQRFKIVDILPIESQPGRPGGKLKAH